MDRIGPLISVLLLQARAKSQHTEERDAREAPDEAVRLAQPEGYLRVFIEEGPQILKLLRLGRKSGMWSFPPVDEYTQTLISAFKASI